MFSFILMFSFSIILMAYGFVALFKRDWIWKVRVFSARLEGKGDLKRDEISSARINRMVNVMAVAALILGIISFVMNVATLVIYLTPEISV